MLLIVTLSVKEGTFPTDALKQMEVTLAAEGFKKEVSSVIKPGREYSVTFEGRNTDKSSVEELLKPIVQQHQVSISIEVEESVRFP